MFALSSAAILSALPLNAALKPNLAQTPQMGWNSWNHFACDISEDLIRQTADALVDSGLSKLGYAYVNLDDCWQASERDADGNIVPDAKRFPSGMKALGDYIHDKGLKFGIYSSAGFKTCQAFPASLGMEELDAAKYAEWGVDYLKYDNCFQDHGPPQARYPPMAKALENSGRDILYSLCEWGRENPAVWAPEISHSWRVSGDIRDDWHSILTRGNIAAPLWRYAGPGGWNDPDMLEVGNGGCSFEEYKSHFSLWAMLKSPLIIGNDIRGLTSEDEAMKILMNEEIIAINQDSLGFQARRVYSDLSAIGVNQGDRLIATKCARAAAAGSNSDDPADQQWVRGSDGTIRSASTGRCLVELNDLTAVNATDANVDIGSGLFAVGTADCSAATTWNFESHTGGAIQSIKTGRCLEVASLEYPAVFQGKRIQTGICRSFGKDHEIFDVREHQSWTSPHGQMLNLYQVIAESSRYCSI
jgi:alpha-galactosidase